MPIEHFTSDQDLLERFVAGRLTQGEREPLESHLRTCEICQRAVREEQALAAGVRRLGRDELKARLRAKVQREVPRAIPWQQIFSVAAVLVVIVGAGIYSHWFGLIAPEQAGSQREIAQENNQPATQGSPQRPGTQDESAQAPEGRQKLQAEGRVESKRMETGAKTLSDDESRRAATPRPAEEAAKEKTDQLSVAHERPRVEQPSVTQLEFGRQAAATVDAGQTREYWTTGVPLQEVEVNSRVAADMREDIQKNQVMAKRLKKDADRESRDQKAAGNAGQLEVVLEELPSASLPLSQQQAFHQQTEVVQTLVRQQGNQVVLTLYLDSLIDGADLRKSRVDQVSPDSLVVSLPNQRLGYRIQQQQVRTGGK